MSWNVVGTPAQVWIDTFGWMFGNDIEQLFFVKFNSLPLEWFLLFLGMCMIPASTLYLVKGGWSELSSDKVLYFLLAFMIGWALVVTIITP